MDPGRIAGGRLAGSPLLSTDEAALRLMPLVYMMACDDSPGCT